MDIEVSTLNIWRLEPRSQLGNYFNSLVINGGVRGNKPLTASYWKSRMILQGHVNFFMTLPPQSLVEDMLRLLQVKLGHHLESKKYLLEGGWRAYSEGRVCCESESLLLLAHCFLNGLPSCKQKG